MSNREPLLSVPISHTLYQQLAHYQAEHQLMSISEAAIAILTTHFDPVAKPDAYASHERVSALERQVAHLYEQLQRLYQLPVSQAVYQSQARADSYYSVDSLTDGEIEDEPDEILYDFLPTDP
jgi:hypothetical protein